MAAAVDHTPDLLVVGSGAAGLTAALTALSVGQSVEVLEADALLGGATALSEGMIWVPGNADALALPDAPGTEEETGSALAYLAATCGNRFDADRARSYLGHAPAMLDLVESEAGLRFGLNRSSRDYVPDAVGATVGRRALNPLPVDGRRLPRALFARLRPPLGTMTLWGGLAIASQDAADFMAAGRDLRAALRVVGHAARYAADRARGWPRGARLTNGNAIVAALAAAVDRKGGRLTTDWPVERLVTEDGRVVGLAGSRGEKRGRLGVILATGGLNAHAGSRAEHGGQASHVMIPAATAVAHLSDLVAGTGAAVTADVAEPMLWAPASVVPAGTTRPGAWPHFSDRAKPGVIVVGPDGRRFANEASMYHDFVPALMRATGHHSDGPHAWIVTDHRALRRYGLGPIGPFPVRLGPYMRSGYLRHGGTWAELAAATGLPADALGDAVARFNDGAHRGEDPEFSRGLSAYDRAAGDPGHRPSPTLGALEAPPFFAIRIVPGDIGTFVGLRVDPTGCALTAEGRPVPGLWAAGNAATPMTGGAYPAAGLTIGQAMTFGFIAARDAAIGSTMREAAE